MVGHASLFRISYLFIFPFFLIFSLFSLLFPLMVHFGSEAELLCFLLLFFVLVFFLLFWVQFTLVFISSLAELSGILNSVAPKPLVQ